MVKRHKAATKEVPELRLVHQWLISRNVSITYTPDLPPDSQLSTLPLCEIASCIETFKMVIGVGEDVLNLLKFFLRKKSVLFDSRSRQFIGVTNKVFISLLLIFELQLNIL